MVKKSEQKGNEPRKNTTREVKPTSNELKDEAMVQLVKILILIQEIDSAMKTLSMEIRTRISVVEESASQVVCAVRQM
jgi:hypothetical protein